MKILLISAVICIILFVVMVIMIQKAKTFYANYKAVRKFIQEKDLWKEELNGNLDQLKQEAETVTKDNIDKLKDYYDELGKMVGEVEKMAEENMCLRDLIDGLVNQMSLAQNALQADTVQEKDKYIQFMIKQLQKDCEAYKQLERPDINRSMGMSL